MYSCKIRRADFALLLKKSFCFLSLTKDESKRPKYRELLVNMSYVYWYTGSKNVECFCQLTNFKFDLFDLNLLICMHSTSSHLVRS